MSRVDVVGGGAGAAGLFCAGIAGQRGLKVLLLDHSVKVAEKVRISGGGRCNFTNIHAGPKNYLSNNPHFAKSALARYTPHDFIAMVDRHKIAWHEKTLGQLFCDDSAKDIIRMLLEEMRAAHVDLRLSTTIDTVEHGIDGFRLQTSEGAITARSLVVACGGKSIPKMGATGFGYRIAEQFGLTVTETRPALVPLTLEPNLLADLAELAGVAVDAEIRHGKTSFHEAMLFTHRGLSGPSILQILIFAGYTFALGLIKPDHVPGVPKEARTLQGWALWAKCLRGIIPSAVLIFAVLGSMGGLPGLNTAIATPTEAGAMGCVGALILAAMHKRLTKDLIWDAMVGTMRLTAMVVFILIGSRVFSMVFQGVDGAKWVEHMLSHLPGGQVGFLIAVNVFVFFLAFFLDFFEIAFIIIPMLGPVADKMGIDLIWFGVLLCVNMQTSFMHPPFGFALFYLRGIADTLFKEKRIDKPVKSSDIYLGSIPWVIMQLVLVAVVIFVPETVTAFHDKVEKIDLDQVNLEIAEDPNDAANSAAPEADAPNADEEQKRLEEMFQDKK